MKNSKFDGKKLEELSDEEIKKRENFINNIWDEIHKFVDENFEEIMNRE